MKYGEYIKILASTGLFGKSKVRFASGLFKAAGPNTEFSEEAVKTWINGTRSCNIERYFPEMKMDDKQFIAYFRMRTKTPGSWEKIQKAFSSEFIADVKTEDVCVDLVTDNPEVFYWSLLNQFQRILHLPESEREVKNSEMLTNAVPPRKPPNEEIRDWFLKLTDVCAVMDTINRKPAILDRNDSARLNGFLDRMDFLISNAMPCNDLLCASIKSFIEALRIQVLTLDANLNSRFSFEDKSASINMEEDEDWKKNRNSGHRSKISDLSLDLILESADPVNLGKLAVSEWGNFRDKMNQLFSEISSWQFKS